MKFCLIGCGDIATNMHAPSYVEYKKKHPQFELAACCDPIESRAKAMQQRVGFQRCYTNHQEMLRLEKPDVVSVIVNETAAPAVGIDVLRAGIPMMIEKPPGRSSADTIALALEARKGNVPCQVAFNRRYMPVLTAMRNSAPEKIQLISYDMFRYERNDRLFANTAVHAIDAVRFLAQADYAHVTFNYFEMPEYGEGVCNIFMNCEMTSGAQAQIRICPMSGASLERAAIHGRGCSIMGYTPAWGNYDSPGRIEIFRDGKAPTTVSFAPQEVFQNNGFCAENEAFFDAIERGESPKLNLEAAINTMLVKECIDHRQKEFLISQTPVF